MMVKRYTMRDFRTEEACLSLVFNSRFGRTYRCPKCFKRGHFNLINGRKRYDCQCGYGIYPLAGTIFHGSATPLRLWFYAIYLFATSQNGIAAKELERRLGVTYKTAWRISNQIRLLFTEQDSLLNQEVQDIFYERSLRRQTNRRTKVLNPTTPFIIGQLKKDTLNGIASHDYVQEIIKNKIKEYVDRRLESAGASEYFWLHLRASLDDTHHIISPKYLQSYVDEVIFRYNHRRSPNRLFSAMLQQAVKAPARSVAS